MSHSYETFLFKRSVFSFWASIQFRYFLNEGSTYGLDFIFWRGNDVKEATRTWAVQSLFQNSRQNPLDTTPTRPMMGNYSIYRLDSQNEKGTTSKIQPVVCEFLCFKTRAKIRYI